MKPTIIDSHLHSMYRSISVKEEEDGTKLIEDFGMRLPSNIRTHASYEDYRENTFNILNKYNILAVTSGPYVRDWYQTLPERIIPGIMIEDEFPTLDKLKQSFKREEYKILGEIAIQYIGILPSDPKFDPYLSLAEELDVPVCIHMNGGGREQVFSWAPKYRASLSNPLLLEETLVSHPKLRLWVAHAGWPMLDEMVNMLFTYPKLFVDVSFIDWMQPKKEFYRYLRRLVEAGFSDQILYGSDQIYWPDAIPYSINNIKSADFLTESQKQDIFFNNAVGFLRIQFE